MQSPVPSVAIGQAHRPVALAVRGLAKRFDRPAVDALDLTVYGGEFYALVGPNGAGKTTTLRMVAGLLRPDAGSITIGGIDALADPVAAKQITAWLSDEPMIYDKLTPFEYLEFVAGLWRIGAKPAEMRARELIGWLGLEPHAQSAARDFPAACGRKWRSLAPWCTTPSSSSSTSRLPGLTPGRPAWSRTCCWSASPPAAPSS